MTRRRIQILLTEKVTWSWKQFRYYLAQRLILGLMCGSIYEQWKDPFPGLLIGGVIAVGSGLLGGISIYARADNPDRAFYHDIRDSVKNGMVVSLITGMVFGLVGGLIGRVFHGLDGVVSMGISLGQYGLFLGVV